MWPRLTAVSGGLVQAAVRQRGLFVGFIAQGLQYGASLLMLPFMVARLSPAEIGVWYLLVTVQGLAAIADFGFGGAFARNIATALAGAATIQRSGFAQEVGSGPNNELAARIVHAARAWYALLACALLAVLLTAGLGYITYLTRGTGPSQSYIQIAWSVMSASIALNMYFFWVNPVLIGANRIEQDLASQIIGRGGFALLGIVVLLFGGGLLALAVAQLVALACARGAAALFLRPIVREFPRVNQDWSETRRLLGIIAPNASRFGVASLSGFLITRSSVFAVTTFVGLGQGGSYAIALQLMSAVLQVSQLPGQFAMTRLVELSTRGNKPAIRSEALRISALYVALFVTGATAVVLGAPRLFTALGKNVHLLPPSLLLLLGGVMLLEGLHSVSAMVLMTGNKVPFTRAAVLSALAVVCGTMLAAWAGWDIAGVIIVQGLVQAGYNNWRWPLMVIQETRTARPG